MLFALFPSLGIYWGFLCVLRNCGQFSWMFHVHSKRKHTFCCQLSEFALDVSRTPVHSTCFHPFSLTVSDSPWLCCTGCLWCSALGFSATALWSITGASSAAPVHMPTWKRYGINKALISSEATLGDGNQWLNTLFHVSGSRFWDILNMALQMDTSYLFCFDVDVISGFWFCYPVALSGLLFFFLMGHLVRLHFHCWQFPTVFLYKFSTFVSLTSILLLCICETYISVIIMLQFAFKKNFFLRFTCEVCSCGCQLRTSQENKHHSGYIQKKFNTGQCFHGEWKIGEVR